MFIERREFLKMIGSCVLSLPLLAQAGPEKPSSRPNILIIMTDQLCADGMSCVMGSKYLHTPNLDSLAAGGMRFTHAYSPNPLCVPMRTCMITGSYPHQTGQQNNDMSPLDTTKFVFMGKLFQDAGYETAYFGKWHIPVEPEQKNIHGFETFVEKQAQIDPSHTADFLMQKHTRPFLAVASFLTPHEVCEWARKEKIPGQQLDEVPPVSKCPPICENFDPPQNETDIMSHMRKAFQSWISNDKKMFPVGDYTEKDWRRLTWGYYRLIERADGFVGTLLQTLRKSRQEENTVVIFLSDHGECHGAHHWNQKTVFYDEAARVPFMISRKGSVAAGVSNLLINVGVDLIPTICDFAGIDIPTGLPGKSLKPVALGNKPQWKRDYIVSQNHMVQCAAVDGKLLQPHGRMVRSQQYKYCLYSEGQRRESLVDMNNDPGEMVNLADNPEFLNVLKQHRAFLREFAEQNNDRTAMDMLKFVQAGG